MEPSNILKIYEDILPIKVRHEETNREATKDENKAELTRGGFRGGGGGRTPPSPQGFDPLELGPMWLTHRVISDRVHRLLVTLSYFRPDRFVQLLSLIPILILLLYYLVSGCLTSLC